MKNKIKKWHIALMSFLTLFIAVFASLFSLRADTVDEETGEVLTDNWELGIVFYDSTVDNGKTPLTQINWDASDGGYGEGISRVITVQINYKNTSAVTTYQPGELEISIPNLIYSKYDKEGTAYNAQWETTVMVSANDSTHTGYDWNFTSGSSPSDSQETFVFTNANTIEEKANLEGSIQILYTITPLPESKYNNGISKVIEQFEDECTHSYYVSLQAELFSLKLNNILDNGITITSPNWPENYPHNLTEETTFWEYSYPDATEIRVTFDSSSKTNNWEDPVYLYDQDGKRIHSIYGTAFSEKTYIVDGNYVKVTMKSNSNYNAKGFSANITPHKKILSNTITLNYTRTYTHPWQERNYTLSKSATKITSYDGLPQGNYYWVIYNFTINGKTLFEYPYVAATSCKILDSFPDDVIVLDENLNQMSSDNNIYTINVERWGINSGYTTKIIYVGYPKSIYNEESGNLSIINSADLYAKFNTTEDFVFQDDDDVSLNLSDFEFTYSGNLYSIYKSDNSPDLFYQNLTGEDVSLGDKGQVIWDLSFSTKYIGEAYDICVGDDLIYITDTNNNYRKLTDNEYYFSSVTFPALYNGSKQLLTEKYTVQLYVRRAGQVNFELVNEFLNTNKTISLSNQNVVEFYFLIKNVITDISYATIKATTYTNNISSLADSGYLYNFDYIEIYKNGTLINEPELSSYSNFLTQLNIASYDMNTYNHYRQRNDSSENYFIYTNPILKQGLDISKSMTTPSQDIENEKFTGTATISSYFRRTDLYNTEYRDLDPEPEVYLKYSSEQLDFNQGVTGADYYDLLPSGMILTSSIEEIIETVSFTGSTKTYLYDINKNNVTKSELAKYIKENITIETVENWRNTGRTWIHVNVDFSDCPLYYLYLTTSFSANSAGFKFSYNFEISYDSYLEYGSVWTNRIYKTDFGNQWDSNSSYYIADNGQKNIEEIDINNNADTTEKILYAYGSTTINSIISTHQDVTTYVKTDQNTYSTGIADASCDSEYEYKLRVRTGSADITNLIIYSNIEEAQQGKSRWKGEFLDTDTSYAENKGYNVKPYYSENPKAGNLYNEDGTLNSDWKEYIPDTPEIVANGLAITFDENFKTYNSSDYLYVYYYYNDQLYRSNKYYGTTLANQTIEIPSTNVYFYWYSSSSGNNAYGFKINNIEPKIITTTLGSTGYSLPTINTTELTGNNYPETNHNPYNNSEQILWHYTYTDSLIIQEHQEHMDKTKVKSLAFEYLDSEGNPSILPANSLTYVLIKMKSPADESIKTLARMDCRTQWNAIDEFGRPVDFITGINSNVVKVALPNSVKEDSVPSISLRFTKEINGTDFKFENMKLDKAAQQTFMIKLTSLTANEDGSYNQLTALLKSNQELIISQIPIGTYLLEELDDNYFDFVEFTDNNDPEIIIEGVTFERTDQGYIITVSEDLSETIEFNIKVTNEIEDERFYEDKDNKENLFLKNKIEEDA